MPHKCGQVGHIRRDCPTQKVSAVDETTQPNQDAAVFETAEYAWILALREVRAARAARPGREGLLIDSGAEQHVCPPGFHAEFPVVQGKREIVSISGKPLQFYGQRSVQTAISDGSSVMPVSVDFCVSDVTAPVLSLGKMVEEGIEFFFSKSKGCWMSKDALDPEATSIGIEQVGRTFEVHEAKMRPKKDLVAPILISEVLPEEESRAPRLLPENRGPSDDERRRHEATHVPYASWCPICVESRGIDARHSSTVQPSEGTELQVQADHMFFTRDMDLANLERSQKAMPVLVATCNEQPAEIFALACPRKGEHAFVQKAFGNYLRRLCRGRRSPCRRIRRKPSCR